ACLAESEPVVIAARLAAEIAAGRTAYLIGLRQASHAISAALTDSTTSPQQPVRLRELTSRAETDAERDAFRAEKDALLARLPDRGRPPHTTDAADDLPGR